MKNEQSLLNRLEAQVLQDLEEERRVLAAFERLNTAVKAGDPATIESAAGLMQPEIERARALALRRRTLLDACAEHFGVPGTAVSLGSLCLRFGAKAERLGELRRQLRATTAEVARNARRLAALVRVRRRVIGDALAILLSDENGSPIDERGRLVDAEV